MGEALAQLPHGDCDVISDIGLPDGNGWELLRQLHLPRPIYAIALSGYGMGTDRERSLAAGYRHHLSSPWRRSSWSASCSRSNRHTSAVFLRSAIAARNFGRSVPACPVALQHGTTAVEFAG